MPRKHLNALQAEFARLVASGMSGTDAYLAVYPATSTRKAANVKASRLMRHPLVKLAREQQATAAVLAITRAVDRYAITAERIADAMARLAFTDISQIADVRTVDERGKPRQIVALRDFSDIPADALAAISEVRRLSSGEVVVKLCSKPDALMNLARH